MSSAELTFPDPIQSVYIFSQAGLPLFVRTTSLERKVDDLMISGFLSAVFSFSEQVVEQGSIRTMEVGDSTFVFERAGNCIFAIQGKKQDEDNQAYLEYIIRQITTEWDKQYGLNAEFMEGIMATYAPFEATLRQIFQQTSPDAALEDTERKAKVRVLEKPVSVPFLLKSARRGLDRVVGAVIAGDYPVIVVGDRARVELAVATLERFAPYSFQSIPWADSMNKSADLIGIAPTAIGPLDENTVLLDLIEAKVEGGQPSKYARDLLKALEKLKTGNTLAYIDEKIGELSSTANQLVELAQLGQLDQEQFTALLQSFDSHTVELLLKICNRLDPKVTPTLAELYEKYTADAESRIEAYLEDF